MKSITELAEWQALITHQRVIEKGQMRDWFTADPTRASTFSRSACDITLDYSRNRIQDETLTLLLQLAERCNVKEQLHAMYAGTIVNQSEQRPALHMRLRDTTHAPCHINQTNIAHDIARTLEKMASFAADVHEQGITDIINIGIGGSHLGPMMTTHALKHFATTKQRFHFLSTPDSDLINDLLSTIQPETSLFIISSKSFTTIETLTNADTIKTWLQKTVGSDHYTKHLVAITEHAEKAEAYGILPERIFPLWHWVGGRYSIWSAIGLPLFLQIGAEHFNDFLQGAHEMDQHALQAEGSDNVPLLLALIGIWNNNFMGASAHAIIPYAYRLKYLIPYLQQLDMESNGKHIDQRGRPVDYRTGPIIFGQEGTEGQHTYHQWLHQSPSFASCDIITINKPYPGEDATIHHHLMKASAISQAEALMRGTTPDQLRNTTSLVAKSRQLQGNRPSNIIQVERLSPYHLGALLALYEHKIAAQGIIWQINSFDQWGVELGKTLLPAILTHLIQDQ